MTSLSLQAVFFDLDGTLMETAYDLHDAFNTLLQKHHCPSVSLEQITPFIPSGSFAMLQFGFPNLSTEELLLLKKDFFTIYSKQIQENCKTLLYEGLEEALLFLEENDIKWGVITNKSKPFAEALLSHHQLLKRCHLLICPEDVQKIKPDPEPLLLACQKLNISPEKAMYIGDDKIDILAGEAAKMKTMAALYGYGNTECSTAKATYTVHHSKEVLTWLQNNIHS